MLALIICIIIGAIVGYFSKSITLTLIIGIITVITVSIIEKIIKKGNLNSNTVLSDNFEIINKIISLMPLIGTKVDMKDGENENFTEDDDLYICIVNNGILDEILITICGDTLLKCNNKINTLKNYLSNNGYDSSGKMNFSDIISYESFDNDKNYIEINTPKKEQGFGYTSFCKIGSV